MLQFEDPAPTTAELTEWIGNWAEWPSDPRLGHELTATFPNELRASVITELETSGTASSATTRLLTDLMSIDEGDPAELGARLMATSYERELRRAVEPQRPPTSIGADASSELARLRSFLHLLLRARARGLLTAVALAARERLTQDFLHSAGLGAAQFASVQASVSVELELAAARVTLGQLGTFDCSWDGSEEGLYTLVAGLAQAFSDAYKEDRARYGTAPWG